MSDLSAFAITRKWPAQHPERLQLYSLPTPNGVKVSIMLEETGLAYEPHLVSFDSNDQFSPEFLSLNPNNKIPAILDPNGPGGEAAGAVRVRRHPHLPGRENRPAAGPRPGPALPDPAVADVPDGRHRPDVRPARLLPQIRRPRLRRQAPARPLRGRIRPPARCARPASAGPRLDDGPRLQHRRYRPVSPGCATWSASTRPATWCSSSASPMCAAYSTPSSRARRCSVG